MSDLPRPPTRSIPSEREAAGRGLNDIRHHIAMAEGFAAGMTYATFKDDNLHLYAVTRCLEIISEASRRLPEALKERHPEIQWKDMAAAGNIYRHEYEDVAACTGRAAKLFFKGEGRVSPRAYKGV
jgi:uncharacterized protein with HEPN domain